MTQGNKYLVLTPLVQIMDLVARRQCMTPLRAFPQFLSILITVPLLVALSSGYQGSLLIELTLPGGGARVHLDNDT